MSLLLVINRKSQSAKSQDTFVNLLVSDFFAVPEIKYEMIENFDELLLYLTEFHEIVTNTSSFAALIKEFYFSKNITSDTYDYARKITDVSSRDKSKMRENI